MTNWRLKQQMHLAMHAWTMTIFPRQKSRRQGKLIEAMESAVTALLKTPAHAVVLSSLGKRSLRTMDLKIVILLMLKSLK
ncbi:hypothetical protein AO354_20975 [Pseudomonas syringae pv. syringae]|nr:hypothetical protein AO354_20975 [Pseudomonas syringae pv. syringae]